MKEGIGVQLHKRVQLAILISGSGRTMQNIAQHIDQGKLDARINVVISSRSGTDGLKRAQQLGLETYVVERKAYGDISQFSHEIFDYVRRVQSQLVCLGGWLSLLKIPDDFAGRVLNIHPALLPNFGGKGMYGQRVHEAVLAAKCNVSGCTVHFADQTYDTGPIIVQRSCPVEAGDTAQSLSQRVFALECEAYPQAIAKVAQDLAS